MLDIVAALDLSGFARDYRGDGRGGAAYDPSVMLAVLLLYLSTCRGERSSLRIERLLVEDVAFRGPGRQPEPGPCHVGPVRRRHQDAIAGVFGLVLGLCVARGPVDAGVVAIDGTKIAANASAWANRTRKQLAEEILSDADQVDVSEDIELGDRRGASCPRGDSDRRDRRIATTPATNGDIGVGDPRLPIPSAIRRNWTPGRSAPRQPPRRSGTSKLGPSAAHRVPAVRPGPRDRAAEMDAALAGPTIAARYAKRTANCSRSTPTGQRPRDGSRPQTQPG